MIGAAKAILRRLLIGIAADSERRNSILMIIGSAAAGILLLLLAPIAVLSTMADIEPPSYSESTFDREAFLSQLMPEQQERLVSMESEGQAIADALAAIGLQEQTIKAQLIYMSYFEDHPLIDFTGYASMFTQEDEQLIRNINGYYGTDIDYTEFMRTYVFVMNSTIDRYMFTDSSTKNSADLAAWCRNAFVSQWRFAENCFGERSGEDRIRCADNIGLIMGYIRYDTESRSFTEDSIDLYYTDVDEVSSMPDCPGVGVNNGSEFGVYVGGGDVAFSSAMGGVQRQALSEGDWTSWCIFDEVSYPQEVTELINEIQAATEETTTTGE